MLQHVVNRSCQTPFLCNAVLLSVIRTASTMTDGAEASADEHSQRAWEHWNKLGAPKYSVAPMVDQSELPFRMLCRRYGANAAYTPMMHARLFSESDRYRAEHMSTCTEDRPLFVQFCANDPDVLVEAAKHVDDGSCDYIDLNFGCPQRIAKRGKYGAFLMDDLPCVESLVRALHEHVSTPVSAKIRIFPALEDTLQYARMIERAGASLVAVHGRTRDQKNAAAVRADWDAIRAVKRALRIPVLGNGDIQSLADAQRMLEATGVAGVMSAAPLLDDPALFWPPRGAAEPFTPLKRFDMALEYLDLAERYPVPMRMVRGHLHKMVGCWMQEHTDIRDEFVKCRSLTVPFCKSIVSKLAAAAAAVGRPHPEPKLPERKRLQLEKAEALAAAQAEQEREAAALAALPAASSECPESVCADPARAPPAKQARVGAD
eukprot:jgi/Ulvmu1/2025/UM120_0021.1